MIAPGLVSDLIGLGILVAVSVIVYFSRKSAKASAA